MAELTLKVNIEADTKRLDKDLEDSLKKPRLLENIKASISDFGAGIRTGGLKALTGGGAEGLAENIGKIATSTAMIGYVYKGITFVGDLLNAILDKFKEWGGSLGATAKQLENVVKLFVLPFMNFTAMALKPFVMFMIQVAVKWYKWLTENLKPKTKTESILSSILAVLGSIAGLLGGAWAGAKIGGVTGALIGGPLGAIIGAIIGGILGLVLGRYLVPALEAYLKFTLNLYLQTFIAIAKGIDWLWQNALSPAFSWLGTQLSAVWESILSPAFNFLATVPLLIWTNILLPAWTFLASVPKLIWETILLPAWTFLKDIGIWIWNDILRPPFQAVADAIRSAISAINNAIAGISSAINYVLSLLGGKKKKQLGGIITTPSMVTVAEREPEIIVPLSKARQEFGMGRSMNYSPTINVYATLNREIDIRNLAEKLAEYSKDALTRRVSYYNI